MEDNEPEQTEIDEQVLYLDEFCLQEADIIDSFEKDWQERSRKNPEEWPKKLKLSEWHEQLKIWHVHVPLSEVGDKSE